MSITVTCGHRLEDGDEGQAIIYASEDCEPGVGFVPCVVYAYYCTPCAKKAALWPEYFETDEAAVAWLDSHPFPQGP